MLQGVEGVRAYLSSACLELVVVRCRRFSGHFGGVREGYRLFPAVVLLKFGLESLAAKISERGVSTARTSSPQGEN